MRKLATVQRVKNVVPIYHPTDGSLTSLNLINFEHIAWQCVAKRDEFAPGDLAVYIEISSIVPDHPVFEFLRSKKFKVKTVRLCGQLSQGLALPVSVLGKFLQLDGEPAFDNWTVGEDVTETIGVTRWEPPIEIKINGSGGFRPFPDHIVPRTDEIRVQSIPHILWTFEDMAIIATEKEDGTSATYFWDLKQNKLRVCGRNVEKLEPDGSVYFLVLKENPNIEAFCRQWPDLVLQGEITAPGIQKNRLGRKGVTFHVFNVYDRAVGNYVAHGYFQPLLAASGVPTVKEVKYWPSFSGETVESLLELAKGTYEGTENPREGIVLRPVYDDKWSYEVGGRLSCKVINNDYLERGGE